MWGSDDAVSKISRKQISQWIETRLQFNVTLMPLAIINEIMLRTAMVTCFLCSRISKRFQCRVTVKDRVEHRWRRSGYWSIRKAKVIDSAVTIRSWLRQVPGMVMLHLSDTNARSHRRAFRSRCDVSCMRMPFADGTAREQLGCSSPSESQP